MNEFSKEAWFSVKGPNDMDVDSTERGDDSRSDAIQEWARNSDWDTFVAYWEKQHESDESVDWMGKGGKGKGKGKNGGKSAVQPRTGPQTSAAWVEKRKCHWCGKVGHLVRDCPDKKAGKPKIGKDGKPLRALDDESGDYEHSMLGSIEFDRSLCSFDFDICGDCREQDFLVPDRCRGIDGVCKSCGYDLNPMSDYERELLSADSDDDDDECEMPTAHGKAADAADQVLAQEGFCGAAFDVCMISLDGPDVVYGKRDYEVVVEPIIETVAPLVTDDDGWPMQAADISVHTHLHKDSWDDDIKRLVMAKS